VLSTGSMKFRIRLSLAILLIAITSGALLSAQTTPMKPVMRAKLDHSQRILEAVVTSNWQLLDHESRAMALVVRDPAWASMVMPEFVRHSEAFRAVIVTSRARESSGSSVNHIACLQQGG
jgi:hypothetical protein